jgi:hypothetical protein
MHLLQFQIEVDIGSGLRMYEEMYENDSQMYLVDGSSLYRIVIFALCDRIYICFDSKKKLLKCKVEHSILWRCVCYILTLKIICTSRICISNHIMLKF